MEIKFRIIHQNKIVGYEHLTATGWKWNWIELNPDKGERWSKGVIEDSTQKAMLREQFTGMKDKKGTEIYNGDIISWPHLGGVKYRVYWNKKECAFFAKPIDGVDKTESYLGGKCLVHSRAVGH